ncbi:MULTISPECIES: hypothetical protein [Hyphobacterium]|uniref:PPM-type phosphatase domain-containing protein n=1 Tax=Hyphobacterium vulgare TaxID=1736751 RepID=A0ABV6ZYP2_9PROT
MPGITFVDAVNFPSGNGTGDDRYGFDEGMGTAWVVDGATDVGTRRVFPELVERPPSGPLLFESDAAWYADTLNAAFTAPPRSGEAPKAYLERIIACVAETARAEALCDLSAEPRHNLPSAGGIWMRCEGGSADFAGLGDCVAIVRSGSHTHFVGQLDLIRAEHAFNRQQLAEPAGKAGGYANARVSRGRMNTEGHHWVFSIHPEAADRAETDRVSVSEGDHILLMSDGFFRLVEPYGICTVETLMDRAIEEDGLLSLVRDLRNAERNPDDDAKIGRLKTKDDATALLVRVD